MKPFARFVLATLLCLSALSALAADPLPSWRDGPSKRAIVTFVDKVTTTGSPDFVAVPERIATFDNDGTLWVEQPMYTEMMFAIDRIHAMAPQHPEWKTTEPYKSVLAGDMQGLIATGEKGVAEIVIATHSGMTTEEFSATVEKWIATARHPKKYERLYTQLVYQPMLELLAYLRANGFRTYIVSGGGQAFMRPWTERVYGIPPEQVIGSYGELKYEMRDGAPVLMKEPKIGLIDDHDGKPVGIQRFIGRRPIFAFGNSDGDQQMLAWTTAGKGARFAGLVHHTDAKREYAYDRNSKVGTLNTALDEAQRKGWTVVDMRTEWVVIFPPER